MSSYLKQINELLTTKNSNTSNNAPDPAIAYESCLKSLLATAVPVDEFSAFLSESHDRLGKIDAALRAIYFRTMRYCISDKKHCDALVKEVIQCFNIGLMIHVSYVLIQGIHYILICSLEREAEYLPERMQALKVITRFIKVSPESLPMAIVRSVVSIAAHQEDPFHRVCLETLREMGVTNSTMVATADGFRVLMDAVLDPHCSDIAESILMTFLYLLHDVSTRYNTSMKRYY